MIALIFFSTLQRYRFEEEEPEFMYNFAWISIGILIIFMGTHISTNVIAGIKSIIQSCKAKNRKKLDYTNSMKM
jgi:hypothetical protein